MDNTHTISDNLVSIVDNQTTTTSLKIAEYFGKRHDNVIQKLKTLDCSPEFRTLNFKESQIDQPMPTGGVKKVPMYTITKDGFVFLTMGFTGAKASKFKEQYIYKFNEMEAQLRGTVSLAPVVNPQELSRLDIINMARESEIGRLEEKEARQKAESENLQLKSTVNTQKQSIAKRNELLSNKDEMIVNTIYCKAGEFKTVSKQIDAGVGAESKTFIIELYAHKLPNQPKPVWDEASCTYVKKYTPEQFRMMNKMAMAEYNSCHEDKYFGVKYKPSLQTRISYSRHLKQLYELQNPQLSLQSSNNLMLN
jgi:Rha family phage regulatory protein